MSRCVSILPFGLEQSTTQDGDNPRHTYQGDFAEKDGETGWNHFEAREYDPVIGRWTSVDPAREFASPYLALANNPINGIDPDGEDYISFLIYNSGYNIDTYFAAEIIYDFNSEAGKFHGKYISGNINQENSPWACPGV